MVAVESWTGDTVLGEFMKHTTTIDFLLGSAPVDWQKAADNWHSGPDFDSFPALENRSSMDDAIRELDGVIQHATRLRGYLDGRYGSGCGDQGHDSSVKMSNSLVSKIRCALGFTQARNNLLF